MIKLDGHQLDINGLWEIAKGRENCELADDSRVKMEAGRSLVDKLTSEKRAIYGINTGFGPLSGNRVAPEDVGKHQVNLLHHLSCGQGDLLSEAETRASMTARANALARGYSGIRPEVVDLLISCLNKGILPEIPSEGSVGASGDLVPLAHMARMLIGLGHVRTKDGRMEALEAFKKHGLTAVVLKSKEGLALVNGTSVMTGIASLSVKEAGDLLSWAEFLSASLMQLMSGEPEVLCEQLHKARGHRGQFVSAQRIAHHLKSHPTYKKEIEDHQWGSHAKPFDNDIEIQDPYSLRCVPQVLGAFQDALWHIESIVAQELNASTDNPLVFPRTESVIHGGNFYGQHVSMVCDYMKNGVIKMALLAERQLDRMVNWRYSAGLPRLLTGGDPGINTGFGGVQLLATSLAAECRMLSLPASIQTIPTNANNQDVVSMGFISAKATRTLMPLARKILAIEALMLAQAADLRKEKGLMGSDYARLQLVRERSPMLKEDRPLFEDIALMTQMLSDEKVMNELLPRRPKNPLTIHLGEVE